MYIDPAAGSMILQVLAASIVAGLATVRRLREAVALLLRRVFVRRPGP